jgi:hypothetical protein
VKPKDPNAPPRERKKKNKDSLDSSAASDLKAVSGPPRPQPKIIESNYQNLAEQHPKVQPQPQPVKDEAIHNRPIQSFFNAPPLPQPHHSQHQPPPPPPQQQQQQQQPVRTSGQNYDPIRSNYDPVRETVITHHPYPSSQGSPSQPPPSMNRASASPSISSLVDPPNQALTSPSIAAQSFFNQQQLRLQRDESHNSVPPSPTASRLAPSAMVEHSVTPKPPTPVSNRPVAVSTLFPIDQGGLTNIQRSPKKPCLRNPKDLVQMLVVPPRFPKSLWVLEVQLRPLQQRRPSHPSSRTRRIFTQPHLLSPDLASWED